MENFLSAVGGILLLDLVLSGDNALVIGAAAAEVPGRQRLITILVGGFGAVILRLLLAYAATLLLNIPWLQTLGAIALIFIAIRLLMQQYRVNEKSSEKSLDDVQKKQPDFLAQILTVLVADVTMSLDNVLAVGALANGDLVILTVGIVISVLFLLLGSTIIAALIDRFKVLIDVAALVLAWTSATMILSDLATAHVLGRLPWLAIVVPVVILGVIVAADVILRVRKQRSMDRARSQLQIRN